MTQILGLCVLACALSPSAVAAQSRLSVEGSAGAQISYSGNAQSVAAGFALTPRLTVLAAAERSYIKDTIDRYPDGYGFERGGTEQFVTVALRYEFLPGRRVSPYALGGVGRGISRPNVNEFFPDRKRREIGVLEYGGGARFPLNSRLTAFADVRMIMMMEASSDYFGARMPVRAGLAFRL